jgi:NAD(P)-dependent dehydrogenase (short-subunit alcohol dehydrogenase family)
VTALSERGGDVVGVRADVANPADLKRFVDAAVARWKRIDGLVNNAGQSAAGKVEDSDDGIWDVDLQLKLYAAVRLTRLVLPLLKVNGGSIVNTLAIGGKTPGAGSAPSAVSRAAGMALTKALSKELGADGIRVNAVLIGLMASGQWERLAAASNRSIEDLYDGMGRGSGIPLNRVGAAREYADLVTFLLSARASYVSGTAINLDGGLCAVV